MSWKRINIKIEKEPKTAEVTIGDSRLVFGKTACKLIPDIFRHKFVEFYSDPVVPDKIGVLFLESASDQSLPFSVGFSEKAEESEKPTRLFIENKSVLCGVFGQIAADAHSVKCKVAPNEAISEMLVIDLSSKRPAKSKYN